MIWLISFVYSLCSFCIFNSICFRLFFSYHQAKANKNSSKNSNNLIENNSKRQRAFFKNLFNQMYFQHLSLSRCDLYPRQVCIRKPYIYIVHIMRNFVICRSEKPPEIYIAVYMTPPTDQTVERNLEVFLRGAKDRKYFR